MSWAKDEWKQGLSVHVLEKITELERQTERLVKDSKQKQFQIETQTAALAKQKRLTDEEKDKTATLKRENQTLSESCDDIERTKQKLQHEIQSKEGRLSCVEGQVSRLKQSLDNEICKHSQTKADLERAQHNHEQCLRSLEKKNAEFAKLNELSSHQKRQIEGQKEKIKSYETQKSFSRSSSQSSCDSYDDFDTKDLQAKLDAEVLQRQKVEKQLKDLQEMTKDSETAFTALHLDNNQELHDVSNECQEPADSNQKLTELRNTLYKVELQLQDTKNELMNKAEALKEKDIQLSNLKQNLDEIYKQNSRTCEDLMKSKTELDQAKSQSDSFERKCKQLNQELQCQRHNAEAIIKGHEDRNKEKEKQHRDEMSSQMQAITILEKQYQDLMTKTKQQEQAAQNVQRELESKIDQKLREVEKLKRQLDDTKHDGSNKESAIKVKEIAINELAQEIKALKQEKNVLLTQIEQEAASKKKLETQLQACKSEIELKNDIVNKTESKAMEYNKEVERVKQKILCDLENAKIAQSRIELDNEELKKKVNFADCCIEEKEKELREVKSKLQHFETELEQRFKEAKELKLNISEEKVKTTRLEAALKEIKQVNICKDVDSTQMADKLNDLEIKCNSLTQKLASTKQELEESSWAMSKLQTDKENLQQSLSNKEIELKATHERACEMELQQTSANQTQICELEKQLILEKENCKIANDKCYELNAELKTRKQAEKELNDQIHISSTTLKEMKLIVENARKELEQEKTNTQNVIVEYDKKVALLQKENEKEKEELSKWLQQKGEEIDDFHAKLAKKEKEVENLREAEVNLQNVLTARDHDKIKLEVSYKEICEKSQKNEQELLTEIGNLKRERDACEGREKNLVTSNDSLKRDILAMQNDYRKACQLSDSKSDELKELIDKFEFSQKEAEHFRQRMSCAEKALKEREDQIKDALKERDSILKELAEKEENLADVNKQLLQKSAEEQSQVNNMQEKYSVLLEKLNLALAQNEDEKQNTKQLAESLEVKIQEVSELTSLQSILESKLDNTTRISHERESQIEQQKNQLNDMEIRFQSTIACLETELQNKKDEEKIIQNKMEQQEQAIEISEIHLREAQESIKTKDAQLSVAQSECEKLQLVYQETKNSESELSEQIQNIKSALNAKTKELESVKEELHKQQMAYQVDIEVNQAKESELHDKMCKLTDDLERSLSCLNTKAEELHNVQERNSTLENECSELRSMMDESAEMVIKLQDEMMKMKEANDRLVSNMEGKTHEISKLKEAISTTEREQLNMLQQKEDLLRSTTNSLNTAMSDKEKLLHLSETRKQDSIRLNQIYEESVKEIECLRKELNVLQNSLNDKSKEITSLSEQKVHLETIISGLNSQNDSCQKEEMGLREKLDIQTALSNEKVQLLEEKIDTLSTVKDKLEDKLSHAEEQLRCTKEINLKLEEDINSSNEKLDVFQIEFKQKDGDVSCLKQQICNFEKVVSRLNAHLQEKDNSIQSANQDLDALRSQFEVTQMDIEDREDVIKELKSTNEALESQVKHLKESSRNLKENLKQTESTLESKANLLFEKSKELEVLTADMNSKYFKSDELMQNLQKTVKNLNDTKSEAESKLKESEGIRENLEHKISELEKHVHKQCEDKVSMQGVFNISVEKLKESKETLEKHVENLENQLRVSTERLNEKSNELDVMKTDIETEKENLLRSKHLFIMEKETLNEEYEDLKKRLEVSVESFAAVKSELASALDSKSLAESMLVAVDGNLQDHKQRLIDGENQIKALNHALAEKEDELLKVRAVSSTQSERLEQLQNCLNELNVEKENQNQEISQKIENVENCKNEEVKALHSEHKIQIETLQNQYKLSVEHVQQSNMKIKELRDALDISRQEIVELNQRLCSEKAELKEKSQEIAVWHTKYSNLISAQENVENDLNGAIERLKNELSTKEDDIARMQEKMHDLDKLNDNKIREYLSELSSVKNENNSLQKEFGSISSKLESVEDDLQRSKHQIIHLNNIIEEREEKFSEEALTMKENIKELKSSKNELQQKSREEMSVLQYNFKSKEEQLTEKSKILEQQNKVLNEEMDGLREQIFQQQCSNEKSANENNEKISELKSRLDESSHKLKISYDRIDKLVEEKRISYDAMQVAERESCQARSELENELTTLKAKLTSITSETESYKQQLEVSQEKNCTLKTNIRDLQAKSLTFERNIKDSEKRYEDRIAELFSSLESTTAELTKVIQEKEDVSRSLQHTKCDLEQALKSLARFKCERNNDAAREFQNQDLRSVMETLQEELNSAKLSKAELSSELASEKETICTLQRKIEMLEYDISAMTSKHEKESSELAMCLESLEKKNSELSEKLTEVSEKHQSEYESNIQSIKEASKEKLCLSEQLEEKVLYSKQLEDSNDELLEVNEKLCGKIEKLESIIEQNKNDITSLRETSNRINRDYEDAVQELQNLRQESAEDIEKKRNKISELMDRLSEMQKVGLSSAEHDNKQLQNTLEIKLKELSEQQLLCKRKESDFRDLEEKFEAKVESMEQKYEDMKYTLKQKIDEIFVLKERMQEIDNLEKKVACSEEIELELRHHLGEVTQELQTLKESTLSINEESLQQKLDDAFVQISSLKDEIQTNVTEFEEEKESIVLAAKEFAIKQEDNFRQEVCAKDEKIVVLESEIQQLKHELISAQNSQKALLEADYKREKELELTKTQLKDDGVVQGKLVELSLKLKLEKQKNSEFEDNYTKLNEQIDKSESARKALQKQVEKLRKDHKSDEEKLVSEVSSLASEIQKLHKDLKQIQRYLDDEKAKTLLLTKENHDMAQELNFLQQEAQRERIHSTETEEECKLLKQQVDGLMSAQTEAEVEKEILIVNESNEKVKLREMERHVRQLRNELEHGKKVNAELDIDKKKYQAEFESTKEKLAAVQKESANLQQQLMKLETELENFKSNYQALTTSLKEFKYLYNKGKEENEKCLRKLKRAENQISSLKDHQLEELEFTKSQLALVENKCSSLLQQLSDLKKSESKELSTMQESMSTKRNVEQKECPAHKSDIPNVPCTNTISSPLVRSMSSLVITKDEKDKNAPTSNESNSVDSWIQPHRLPASRLPKREEVRRSYLNKRSLDHESQSISKRCRLTNQGEPAPGPHCESPELPEGLPEVVQKGFNDIPDVPIKSPFILRRTTAQVLKKGLVKPKQSVKPKGSLIPKINRNSTLQLKENQKENPAASGSPPRGLLRPPTTVLSPRKINVPSSKSSDCMSPKKSKIPSRGTRREHAISGKGRQGPTTRSSAQLQMHLNQIKDTANEDKEDFETCNMQ